MQMKFEWKLFSVPLVNSDGMDIVGLGKSL